MVDLLSPVDPGRAPEWADRLIEEFGSIGGAVLGTRPSRTARCVDGSKAAVNVLDGHRRAMHFILREKIAKRPVLVTRHEVLRYLWATMAFDQFENVRALFLDTGRGLIAEQIVAKGGADRVPIDPRAIMVRALELVASGIVLVHNHPSGDPSPSLADQEATRRLTSAGNHLGIYFLDHIIVAREGCETVHWDRDVLR